MAVADLLGAIVLRLSELDEHTLKLVLTLIQHQGTMQTLKPGQRYQVETDGHTITAKAGFPDAMREVK